jgi:hypothetical protein
MSVRGSENEKRVKKSTPIIFSYAKINWQALYCKQLETGGIFITEVDSSNKNRP